MRFKIVLLILLVVFTGCSKKEPPIDEPKSDFETVLLNNDTIQITKYIGESTFVVIPDHIDGKRVTEIGDNAFANLTIEEITFPFTIKKVGDNTFLNTLTLKRIIIFGDTPFYVESFALDERQSDPSTGYFEINCTFAFYARLQEFRHLYEAHPMNKFAQDDLARFGEKWLSYLNLIKYS